MRYYKALKGTDLYEKWGTDLIPAFRVAQKGFPRDQVEYLDPQDIATAIRGDYQDDMDAYADLCDMADMSDEWQAAGNDWYDVAEKAANKLGVYI